MFVLAFIFSLTLGFTNTVSAMTPTLSLSNNGNNTVFVTVYGDPNSSVNLYYNNYSGLQNLYLGSTNSSGYLSTSLNLSTYNINPNTTVYVIVNNQQSSVASWPTNYYQNNYYTNTGLTVSSLTLPLGSSATLSLGNNYNGVYVSNNSNSGVVTVNNSNSGVNTLVGCTTYNQYSTITGQPCYMPQVINYNTNSVVIYASSIGYSTLTICANNSSTCNTINVNVVNSNSIIAGNVLGVSTINNSCTLYRTLRYGMYGSDVSCLKQLLANKGYLVNNNFDSYFDYETRNAVMLFQQDHYLGTDGVVGRNTRNYLY